MLFQCWASVEHGKPTLKQHWVNILCLLGGFMVGQRRRRLSNIKPTLVSRSGQPSKHETSTQSCDNIGTVT